MGIDTINSLRRCEQGAQFPSRGTAHAQGAQRDLWAGKHAHQHDPLECREAELPRHSTREVLPKLRAHLGTLCWLQSHLVGPRGICSSDSTVDMLPATLHLASTAQWHAYWAALSQHSRESVRHFKRDLGWCSMSKGGAPRRDSHLLLVQSPVALQKARGWLGCSSAVAVAFRPWNCCKRVFEWPPAVLSTATRTTPNTTTTRAVTCLCQSPNVRSRRATHRSACCICKRIHQAHCLASAMLVVDSSMALRTHRPGWQHHHCCAANPAPCRIATAPAAKCAVSTHRECVHLLTRMSQLDKRDTAVGEVFTKRWVNFLGVLITNVDTSRQGSNKFPAAAVITPTL